MPGSEESKERVSAPACALNYDVNDPLQQEVSRILKDFRYDIMGIISLGTDGIMRSLTADRKVLSAVPFGPELVKAFHDRIEETYRKKHCAELEEVDSTKTPKEKWFEPDEGVLPPPLAQEKVDAVKNSGEEKKKGLRKLLREKENYVDTSGVLND
ncbi:hypothetical protein CC86DRAFT_442826 [Ophiobolus disseminans]|uniref:Uncharacterized protein n=1 Tax=Ophiobolus disseminans TaxID=1469910 RepID=A0A6A7AJ14_9PLEO|nr:hypothetical protein CC86DRAFT_442826 [Ophiobolus disseminans]